MSMRGGKNATFLLLTVVVVITIFWMNRRKSSPYSLPKASSRAVSSQVRPEPTDISSETTSPSTPPHVVESSEARIGPADIYPNFLFTPGATNPDIEQSNIGETICNPTWTTKSIRPPTTYTHHLKVDQILEYGYADTDLRDYEEDHLIPLELGGNPTDPRNLWPEPYEPSIPEGGARFKDKVENYLHAQVCAGNLTLKEAQTGITEDWYSIYTTSVRH
jgi:hypothetical protein